MLAAVLERAVREASILAKKKEELSSVVTAKEAVLVERDRVIAALRLELAGLTSKEGV